MTDISQKICLVGDFGVGKTSLIRRFVDRQFSDRYLSTVGVKISRRQVEVAEHPSNPLPGRNIQLLIWDLEGRSKFKGVAPSYLQGAKGVIIVSDLTRPETVRGVGDHIDLFHSVNAQGAVALALNKADLVADPAREAKSLLDPQQYRRAFATYLTSAKSGIHVDEIFEAIALKLLAQA